MYVLSAGLPVSAKDILSSAMNEAFDGAVDVQELTKENLRSRVRLSKRNSEIVLVILDRVSSDTCSDIENGLYSSDKYFTYTTDKELVVFLNNKYGLNIEIAEEVDDIPLEKEEGVDIEILKEYEEKLSFKNSIISNLEIRIKDIQDLYEGSTSEELISLDENIMDLKSELGVRETRVSELEEDLKSKSEELDVLGKKLDKVTANYSSVLEELNELKVHNSKQSGVLHDKDIKINSLNDTISKLEKDLSQVKELEELVAKYREDINNKERVIGDLRVDIESKDRDIVRYVEEIEGMKSSQTTEEEVQKLKDEISKVSSENDDLKKKLNNVDSSVSTLKEEKDDSLKKIESLEKENSELSDRIKADSESLSILNKEKLELQSKLSLIESANESGNSEENLIAEIQDLRNRLADMSKNIFAKIGSSALPNASVGGKVLSGQGRFNNIRFAFAGSAESRKGTYRCLLDEFRNSKNGINYLIVDLVSETSVDYVFEVKQLVPGIEWFRRGGSVQPFLSNTALKNTKVLSAGLGYINDSYFLCIDWEKRLLELDNSGYKVVLFCGDISNLVGRVLHESFADYGDSVIYVAGNSIGSRTIVTNLRGLSNAKSSVVAYYDFNSDMNRFYNMVNKTNECRILSTRNVGRR